MRQIRFLRCATRAISPGRWNAAADAKVLPSQGASLYAGGNPQEGIVKVEGALHKLGVNGAELRRGRGRRGPRSPHGVRL